VAAIAAVLWSLPGYSMVLGFLIEVAVIAVIVLAVKVAF